MITVHHLEASRSQRILWLLEELGLPYELVEYARDPVTMRAPAALRAVHPLGKSPVVVDGDLVLAESGAVIEDLLDRHDDGTLRPAPGTPEHRRFRYWLHYAEGSLLPNLLLRLVFSKLRKAPVPFFVRPVVKGISDKVQQQVVDPQVTLHLDFVEAELGRSPWFAGDAFSAADIQMSYPLEAASHRGGTGDRPHIADFLARIRAREAYRRAAERGGGFTVP